MSLTVSIPAKPGFMLGGDGFTDDCSAGDLDDVSVVVGGAEAGSVRGEVDVGDAMMGDFGGAEMECQSGADTTPAPNMTSRAGPTTSCVSSTMRRKLTGSTS